MRVCASACSAGRVTVVGAGPGAPDLLTLRGAAALAAADAVVYDELGDCEAMIDAHCAAGVRRVYVGKRGGRGQVRARTRARAHAHSHARMHTQACTR